MNWFKRNRPAIAFLAVVAVIVLGASGLLPK